MCFPLLFLSTVLVYILILFISHFLISLYSIILNNTEAVRILIRKCIPQTSTLHNLKKNIHLNLVLSARLNCLDDQWKGPFFPHSHCDTSNTELIKEWWYLITFQGIAPASEIMPEPLLNSHKWITYRCTSSWLFSSNHTYTFDITCCRGNWYILCGQADPVLLGVSTGDFSIRPWQWD